MAKKLLFGIDLGTTNSVVSYRQSDGQVKVNPKPEGNAITPSVVAFKAGGEQLSVTLTKRQSRHKSAIPC